MRGKREKKKKSRFCYREQGKMMVRSGFLQQLQELDSAFLLLPPQCFPPADGAPRLTSRWSRCSWGWPSTASRAASWPPAPPPSPRSALPAARAGSSRRPWSTPPELC